MRIVLVILAFALATPAVAQDILLWGDPRAADIWPEHAGLGDGDIHVFENQWLELQIIHGFAACGNKGRCPARFVENDTIVGEFLVCNLPQTYALSGRMFSACGKEYWLPPGD